MKTRLSRFLAAIVLSCAAIPATAVTFGQPDGNAHPFVGNILFERPDGYFSCTGTLLSSSVMLTAGHCTEESGVANVRTWVKFTPDININSGCSTRKCLNKFLDDPKNGWVQATAYPHPNYDDFNQFPATYDVGILVLATPVSMATYGTLPPIGFLTTIKGTNNSFTVVGYGLQGILRPFASDDWTRYVGTVKLAETQSFSNGGQSAKFTNNPGTDGGSCFGDSGGPVFYQNTTMIVAVVSWGITPCIGADYQFRTDIPTTQDFVDLFF
jgi:secreted trypsin-like serine protease